MKIVPVVDECGIEYVIVKAGPFGRRYLYDDGRFRSGMALVLSEIERFKSPKEAAKKIRQRFGDTVQIDVWEGRG